ncbi:MAG: long-chain fatty acid--CoA ligase [Verrucomicrobia bacterium]|nr:long-chain fatty acid--CoA ligase [Verrucomicrobiota bacterium]
MNKNSEFADYAARLRALINHAQLDEASSAREFSEAQFNQLACELFALQYRHNATVQKFCDARGMSPAGVVDWREIPCLPTAAFKEFDVTCWPSSERTTVFHSSGTTEQTPSRHFHNAESLALYKASLRPWFAAHVPPAGLRDGGGRSSALTQKHCFLALTPPAALAPRSSLVHMFETVRCEFGSPDSMFAGAVGHDGAWSLDARKVAERLQRACAANQPLIVLGTAFSFVHLLDFLVEEKLRLQLPAGSRALETGGYKGRSREIPKPELHALISERLGIPAANIVCEYGMSELSSQAYDHAAGVADGQRIFYFPPWARARVVSPETGREVADGEMGLIQVVDLANLGSALAIQTEDLAVRRGEGFELLGRATLAEPRGCSLMQVG